MCYFWCSVIVKSFLSSVTSSTGNKQSEGKMDPLFWPSEADRFRRFTPESLAAIEERIANKKKEQVKVKEKTKETKEQGVEEDKLTPQLDLKICKTLPSLYGDIPAELVGEPLEDFDPYYSDHKVKTCQSFFFFFLPAELLRDSKSSVQEVLGFDCSVDRALNITDRFWGGVLRYALHHGMKRYFKFQSRIKVNYENMICEWCTLIVNIFWD